MGAIAASPFLLYLLSNSSTARILFSVHRFWKIIPDGRFADETIWFWVQKQGITYGNSYTIHKKFLLSLEFWESTGIGSSPSNVLNEQSDQCFHVPFSFKQLHH